MRVAWWERGAEYHQRGNGVGLAAAALGLYVQTAGGVGLDLRATALVLVAAEWACEPGAWSALGTAGVAVVDVGAACVAVVVAVVPPASSGGRSGVTTARSAHGTALLLIHPEAVLTVGGFFLLASRFCFSFLLSIRYSVV